MHIHFNLFAIIFLSLTLSGCLSVKEGIYKYNTESGTFEVTFHDIRSEKQSNEPKDEDHVTKDWADLKDALKRTDDYDPKIVKIISKELFQEKKDLSAKLIYQVLCPTCYGNPVDILKILNGDGRWESVNDEIMLFFSRSKQIVATNGKVIQTEKNTICVWPADEKVFEYTIFYENPQGVSLLDKYLSEKDPAAAPVTEKAATAKVTAITGKTPIGLWKTFDDKSDEALALVRIYEQDGKLFGKLEHSLTPGEDQELCTECKDERKDQQIAGLMIIRNMKPMDGYYSGGDILDPFDGSVYRCKLRLNKDGSRLIVKGYLGATLFGRSQTWQRQE